jgi:hypothetical protein
MESSESDSHAVDATALNNLKQYVSCLCAGIFQGTSGILHSVETDENVLALTTFMTGSDTMSLFITRVLVDGKFGMSFACYNCFVDVL